MLQDVISQYKDKLDGHTELRLQRNMDREVRINSGNITSNASSVVTGLSARVYRNGYWGFASSTEYDESAVDEILTAAKRNASFLTSRLGVKSPELSILPDGKFSTKAKYADVEQKKLIDFARKVDAYILSKYPKLAARRIRSSVNAIEKVFITSGGADGYALIPRSFVSCTLSVEADDGTIVDLWDRLGGGPGFWDNQYSDPEKVFGLIDKLYESLMKKREGVFTDAGVREVVIDSELAGILAHEAIGHTTEADLVMSGSVAGPFLGKQAASEIVTLVDFANTYNGDECPQPVYADDEGTAAKDVVIIKDGVLKAFMHNRESAAHFNHEPTGNARAYLFSDEPLIRMRNTAILPGKDKRDDMIASIKDGYYLTQTGNGQADLTSEFMFGVNMGYEIKDGKLGKAIRDTTISGVAFDLLKTITMISDEMVWNSNGMCGKKQPMPVGMGGPSIKCKVNIGGR